MVIVSHSQEFIFLKTRKTAGTSIEMLLEPFCRSPGAVITERTPTRITRHGIVGRRLVYPEGVRRLPRWSRWYNHMTAAEVRAALGSHRWTRYRKITSVRNPFDLMVSRYTWWTSRKGRQQPTELDALRADFGSFVEMARAEREAEIVHLDGTFIADHAVRYETLAQDVARLWSSVGLGAQPPTLPHTKNMARARALTTADYFTPRSIDRVRAAFGWCFDRFDYPDHPASNIPSVPEPTVEEATQ